MGAAESTGTVLEGHGGHQSTNKTSLQAAAIKSEPESHADSVPQGKQQSPGVTWYCWHVGKGGDGVSAAAGAVNPCKDGYHMHMPRPATA